MSTKAYYPISEIGAGKTGFSKTRSIIEAAFYGNNVVKVNTLKEAYELAKTHLEQSLQICLFIEAKSLVLREMLKFYYLTMVLSQDVTQLHAALPENQVLTAQLLTKWLWMLFMKLAGKPCTTQRYM